MADSLQSYIKEGYLYGPFTEEEMPFSYFKVSPLMMRPNPNGSVRVFVDMSHPYQESGKVKVGDVNEFQYK